MPDYQRFANIRQGLSAILQYAGQTATWRQFISASAGLAEFGMGTANSYVARPFTGIFDAVKPQEIWQAGGFILAGDVWVTTIEPLAKRDEVQWDGARYQVVTEAAPMTLFGTAAGRTLIRRA